MHPAFVLPNFRWREYINYLEEEKLSKDHIERTKRMIEVMQAYVDGERLEARLKRDPNIWVRAGSPVWNFEDHDYRVAKIPDTINWDHVAPEFKYMARDKSGFGYLHKDKPSIKDIFWNSDSRIENTDQFSSYRKGTVDWKESLVIRPGCE